jgi:DNA-binding PadR family transcriptional regulator
MSASAPGDWDRGRQGREGRERGKGRERRERRERREGRQGRPGAPGGHERQGRHGGGFGPPFGRFHFGWGPPPRGPQARRGDVRAAVLVVLADGPLHGYQIIQEIAERSGGVWRPSPGSVYPVVQQLADEGLVRVERAGVRRVVHLTDQGQNFVERHADELAEVWENVSDGVSGAMMELHDLIGQVAAAAAQVAHAGSPAQQAAAGKILSGARRSLYQLLAEGDDPTNRETGQAEEET